MAFKVGPNSKNPPLTRDGIPYLFGSHNYVDSTVDQNTGKWYCDDSIYGGYDYAQISIGATSSTGAFSEALKVQDGIVVIGAPDTDYESRHEMGMAVILDCPIYDSIGNNKLTRISHPDYASYPTGYGSGTSWAKFGKLVAIDDNKIAVAAPNARENSSSPYIKGACWIFKTDGTLISELDPTSTGVEFGKDSNSTKLFQNGLEMDGGVIATASNWDDSTNGVNGILSLFDYSGSLKRHVRFSDIPNQKLQNITPCSFTTSNWTAHLAMGDGIILTAADDWGMILKFDYNGNYLDYALVDDYLSVYRNFTSNDPGAVGIGCGRIVVGVQASGTNNYKLLLLDYNFNLVKIIDPPSISGLGTDDFRLFYSKQISIKNGIIAIGVEFDDNNGQQAGSLLLFDLDGNFLNRLVRTYNPLNKNTTTAFNYFGSAVDIGPNYIVGGGLQTGDVWKWSFNSRITPYDLKRINKPKSYP